jgi:hypothetical protein
MRKLLLIIAAVVLSSAVFGQAKKPTIMVVPSDQYCISKGYKLEFDDQGSKKVLPDYKAALQNDSDLRLVISKMSGIMADRGFPLKDLEQELKSLESESAEMNMMTSKDMGMGMAESPVDALKRTAKADIIMDLSFEVKAMGPKKSIRYILNGLDAYTSKNVASTAGEGQPSSAASVGILLEEAVLGRMDEFNDRLMAHFEDMFAKGREVKVMVRVWEGADDLETEYEVDGEEDELGFHIENWFADNTVEGRFNLSDGTENFMKFEQVRIPLYYERKGQQRAMDTRRWVKGLSKMLKDATGEDNKIYMRGLGEAWIILGSK